MSVRFEFETCEGENFVHITSTSGIFGHAKEVRNTVPKGTWLTMPDNLRRLTPWMVSKCGFVHLATVNHEGKIVDILKKE